LKRLSPILNKPLVYREDERVMSNLNRELAEALEWDWLYPEQNLSHLDGVGKPCCDDGFIRLVEAELEKRGLLDTYAAEIEAWAWYKQNADDSYHVMRLLLTAPADVKAECALRVLREQVTHEV
jgi:hypothetical protein